MGKCKTVPTGRHAPLLPKHQTVWLLGLAILLYAVFAQTPACHADGGWADHREAGPFVCHANFSLKRYGPLFQHLAELQNDLVSYLGIAPAQEKIALLLFRDEWTYRDYLRRNFPNVPYRRALFIKKQNRPGIVLVHLSENFAVDARHECTHALLHASLPIVPLWLDEGLAGYFEVPPQQRTFDNPHAKNLRWSLFFGSIANLSQLEKIVDFNKMSKTNYRDSWAWVHFMLHGSQAAHGELIGYLGEIQSGRRPEPLSRRLAKRMPQPAAYCAAHHRNWKANSQRR